MTVLHCWGFLCGADWLKTSAWSCELQKFNSVVLLSFCKIIFCLPRPSIWRWVHVTACASVQMEGRSRLESLEKFLSLLEQPNIYDTWPWFLCDSYSLLTFCSPSWQRYYGKSLLSYNVSLSDTRLYLLEESLNKFQVFIFASNPLSSQCVREQGVSSGI